MLSKSSILMVLLALLYIAPPSDAGGMPQLPVQVKQTLATPSSYTGLLPCASCPGMAYTLNLQPDNVFYLRWVYQGQAESFYDIGTWSVDNNILTLMGDHHAVHQFLVKDANALQKLDTQGKTIQSSLNYTLSRIAVFEPLEPRMPLRGMYNYMADAGLFQECLTGQRLPVEPSADNAALEAAYSKIRQLDNQSLLVNVEGSIAMRPKMEGAGTQPTLVVEHFLGIWPGETCGPSHSTALLENTYWKLVRLGNEPVILGEGDKQPHIIFVAEGKHKRVQGSGVCNRLLGRYQLKGKRLKFADMTTPNKACKTNSGLDTAFIAALTATSTWEISGEHLELSNSKGVKVARFESLYLR
ncbi:MAG: META domain-containing protein [Methylococcales bacterium]|nr:META domain-containing protein [Methylococcales bacterium]